MELADENTFYECSSYGPDGVGPRSSRGSAASQLLFGSDRPMARPESLLAAGAAPRAAGENTRRALGEPLPALAAAALASATPGELVAHAPDRRPQRGLVPAR